MFALLTLPRGVPYDPEETPAHPVEQPDLPAGIIIRPGRISYKPEVTLRAALTASRA